MFGCASASWFASSLLALGCPQSPVEEGSKVRPPSVEAQLVQAMRGCLRVARPSTNVVRKAAGASLFDGSYDWHSNLFAHWALLVHARRAGDEALAAWVLEPLTPGALLEERARLAEMPRRRRRVFPYGEGWLLQLLAELERHREVADGTRAWRREIERELLAWLEEQPFPDMPERARKGALEGRRFVGTYRSWAWCWFQLARSRPLGEGVEERLHALYDDKLAPHVPAMLREPASTAYEFLDVPAIAVLAHRVRGDGATLELPEFAPGPELPAKVTLRDTHALGKWISRLWPLAVAAHDDAAARAALDAELARYLARTDLWDGDFTVIRHWIPQFLWFTVWLADSDSLPTR